MLCSVCTRVNSHIGRPVCVFSAIKADAPANVSRKIDSLQLSNIDVISAM